MEHKGQNGSNREEIARRLNLAKAEMAAAQGEHLYHAAKAEGAVRKVAAWAELLGYLRAKLEADEPP